MLWSEMLIQEVVCVCASFEGVDGSDLLDLCFDDRTEFYTDVVFDFLTFLLKIIIFYETYLYSSVDKKRML